MDLLEKVRANRESHVAAFETAWNGYVEYVTKELARNLRDAKKGKVKSTYHFVMPQNHAEDYDAVIDVLDMSVGEDIEISQVDFRRYARDEWEWKDQFTATNAMYVGASQG
jgi:hypothetical protein